MVSQIVRYSTPRGSPAHTVTSPTSPLTTTMTPITPAGTGGSVSVPSTGAYSSSRFVEKTSVLDDMDDDRDDNDNNNDNSDNRANILQTLARGRNVIEVGPIKKYDDLENNAIRGSLTIRGIITRKTNEDVALSELVRTEPEKCAIKSIRIRAVNDNNKKTGVNDNMTMTMTMTTDTNTNTSSHSSSRSVNSITDRRLEGSNHEAGEHQRDDVVTDGREVNGSTTVSEKREDEKTREYKTDKSQDVDEDEEEEEEEEEERDDGSLTKKENGIPERAEDLNNNGDQSLPTDDDESSSESVEDEDDRTVISVRHGSDSDRTARGSSLLSDRSNEEDLFDDNGWLVTDQDLEERKLPRTREHSLEGEEIKKIENPTPKVENLEIGPKEVTGGNLARSPESSLRSRVYRQSNLGKNGWLISDESESESERAVSPDDKKTETMETRNEDDEHEDNNTNKEDNKESDNESKREPWSIEENGWMIVNEDQSSVRNNEPTKESQTMEKTDFKRGRSSTIRSQTTTDLVSRANVENGALVANATRSKETERSDEHEAASDVNISIPMQMVTTVFCVSVLCYSVLMNLFL